MDATVGLVSAYLQMNGYFVQTEVPVVERTERDPPRYSQTTDIDLLAIRFPSSVHHDAPSESERWAGLVAIDPALGAPERQMDVIIGEVKEGRVRLNPNLTSEAVLRSALWHTGGCMNEDLDAVVSDLRSEGVAEAVHCHGGTQRIRIVGFGGAPPEKPADDYRVVLLRDVLGFMEETIRENHEVFKVVDYSHPALSMLLLRSKMAARGS